MITYETLKKKYEHEIAELDECMDANKENNDINQEEMERERKIYVMFLTEIEQLSTNFCRNHR